MHTHYDAQATWSSSLSPSSWNGVTTLLLGNCGVGFAPCHPDQRDMLVKLMEGVEDIPEVVLTEGLPWNWHSFPEFLDALGSGTTTWISPRRCRMRRCGSTSWASAAPTGNRATEQDRQRMAELAEEGLRAGALGFSTSRTLNHRTLDGKHIPTLRAEEAELTAIAHAMRSAGAGWLQIVSDFEDQDKEFGLFRRLAEVSGRPVTLTLLQSDTRPDGWRDLLGQIEAANAAGLRITGQVRSRPTSVLLGFELSQNPFMGRPSYRKIAASAICGTDAAPARPGLPGGPAGGGRSRAAAAPNASSAGTACSPWATRRTTSPRPRTASPPERRARAGRLTRSPTTC